MGRVVDGNCDVLNKKKLRKKKEDGFTGKICVLLGKLPE